MVELQSDWLSATVVEIGSGPVCCLRWSVVVLGRGWRRKCVIVVVGFVGSEYQAAYLVLLVLVSPVPNRVVFVIATVIASGVDPDP